MKLNQAIFLSCAIAATPSMADVVVDMSQVADYTQYQMDLQQCRAWQCRTSPTRRSARVWRERR